MTERLKGKTALVLGAGCVGEGWGNGNATAVTFAREGANVVCADINEGSAAQTAELVRREGSWLIAARTGNAVWWSGNPAVLGLEGVPNAFPRHEGHLSPAWLGI